MDKAVRCRLGELTADEVHLLDEWGADFRVAYQEISTPCARIPDHAAIFALSATFDPRRQIRGMHPRFEAQIQEFPSREAHCERRNVDLIIYWTIALPLR